MRKDHSLYKTPVIPDGHVMEHAFQFTPELKKLVAFSSAMKLPRHRWFYYKPGFAPAIVNRLFDDYMQIEGLFLDPFSGVGTAPIVASQRGMPALGLDISPLGISVGNGKMSTATVEDVNSVLSTLTIQTYTPPINQYYLNKAYTEEVVRQLLSLRDTIRSEAIDDDVRGFLEVCLLNITDKFADAKKDGGFLRYFERQKPEDVLAFFKSVCLDLAQDLSTPPPTPKPQFQLADARSIPCQNESVANVITSPPYLNRYDYTRIYALELAMLGLEDEQVRSIRKETLKSHVEAVHRHHPELNSSLLSAVQRDISERELSNPQIPTMISGYFHDMAWNIQEIARVLKPGGFAAYVVGNCRFSGVHVEVDAILAQIGESFGLDVEEILIAKTRGSSAQQVRKYGDLPLRESIVVFRKPVK